MHNLNLYEKVRSTALLHRETKYTSIRKREMYRVFTRVSLFFFLQKCTGSRDYASFKNVMKKKRLHYININVILLITYVSAIKIFNFMNFIKHWFY